MLLVKVVLFSLAYEEMTQLGHGLVHILLHDSTVLIQIKKSQVGLFLVSYAMLILSCKKAKDFADEENLKIALQCILSLNLETCSTLSSQG